MTIDVLSWISVCGGRRGEKDVLCIVGFSAASLASVYWMPTAPLQLWQPKISSDVATCPWRCKITPIEHHRSRLMTNKSFLKIPWSVNIKDLTELTIWKFECLESLEINSELLMIILFLPGQHFLQHTFHFFYTPFCTLSAKRVPLNIFG